ncbi:hypothetical protein KIL84_012185 [Mauremys mutica]|uniref:Uncharacterized protein n=1 Tax=Mauremys mutica TaxID=74926 RepID=A0A9D4B1T3_9SAUR|nr:hypothetical protein KIL84_012185 [Mauremys mutica]
MKFSQFGTARLGFEVLKLYCGLENALLNGRPKVLPGTTEGFIWKPGKAAHKDGESVLCVASNRESGFRTISLSYFFLFRQPFSFTRDFLPNQFLLVFPTGSKAGVKVKLSFHWYGASSDPHPPDPPQKRGGASGRRGGAGVSIHQPAHLCYLVRADRDFSSDLKGPWGMPKRQ